MQQYGAARVRAVAEACTPQIGAAKGRVAEVGAPEGGALELRAGEVRIAELGVVEPGARQVLAAQVLALGGTWSNELAVAADFSEASLEDLGIQIMDATNPRGLKISLMPKRLIIPTSLVFEAERVLKSQLQNDTTNNAINALRSKGIIPEIAVNHFLTDTDAFFIKTNAPNGLTWFDRETAQFTQDSEFDTENAKAKIYRRFVPRWGDPRGMYGSPGA